MTLIIQWQSVAYAYMQLLTDNSNSGIVIDNNEPEDPLLRSDQEIIASLRDAAWLNPRLRMRYMDRLDLSLREISGIKNRIASGKLTVPVYIKELLDEEEDCLQDIHEIIDLCRLLYDEKTWDKKYKQSTLKEAFQSDNMRDVIHLRRAELMLERDAIHAIGDAKAYVQHAIGSILDRFCDEQYIPVTTHSPASAAPSPSRRFEEAPQRSSDRPRREQA